jgi:hypothetical protein
MINQVCLDTDKNLAMNKNRLTNAAANPAIPSAVV